MPVRKICRMVPNGAGLAGEFKVVSWFSTPGVKMAGATAVSATVNGALLALSAVTTICADDWPLKLGGICRLICLAPV